MPALSCCPSPSLPLRIQLGVHVKFQLATPSGNYALCGRILCVFVAFLLSFVAKCRKSRKGKPENTQSTLCRRDVWGVGCKLRTADYGQRGQQQQQHAVNQCAYEMHDKLELKLFMYAQRKIENCLPLSWIVIKSIENSVCKEFKSCVRVCLCVLNCALLFCLCSGDFKLARC